MDPQRVSLVPTPGDPNTMSDAQRASILRTLQASNIWTALRLPANTTADVVRQAFRRESRLLHPDKNPMPEAEAQASHSAATACTAGPARIRLGYTQLAWTRSAAQRGRRLRTSLGRPHEPCRA